MAPSNANARSYPKRKRAAVSYYDDGSDGNGATEAESEASVESDVEEAPARKVSCLSSLLGSSTAVTNTCQKAKANNGTVMVLNSHIKQKTFNFMELPGELKNKIYDQALKHHKPIILVTKTRQHRHIVQFGKDHDFERGTARPHWGYMVHKVPYRPATPITKPFIVPGLLAVSRQVYAEAQPILYGGNVFILKDPAVLHTFCAKIGPRNCAALKELVLKEYGYSGVSKAMNHAAFTMLASAGAVNLNRLHLDCEVHAGGGKLLARQMMRDGHFWFEAVGAAKGKRDAAIAMLDAGSNVVIDAHKLKYNPIGDKAMAVKVKEGLQEFQTELRLLLEMGS